MRPSICAVIRRSRGKVDWTQDSPDELVANIAIIHKSFDIVGVHLYAGEEKGRFGSPTPVDLLAVVKSAADKLKKPLFIGEFGDANIRTAGPGSFVDRMLDEIVKLQGSVRALWVWEFYQRASLTSRMTVRLPLPTSSPALPIGSWLISWRRTGNLVYSHPRPPRMTPRLRGWS